MRRRMDGFHWYGGAKSKLLPGCSGKTEIGLQEALSVSAEKEIIIVEGGPDLLAALGYFPKCGVICMPSVMTDFSIEARRALQRRKVLIIPHADEAGREALEKWSKQLGDGANLEWLELDEGAKDFNDWAFPVRLSRSTNVNRFSKYLVGVFGCFSFLMAAELAPLGRLIFTILLRSRK